MNRSLLAVVLMLATLWLSPAAHAQCPTIFVPATNYPVGTNPASVAVGDFNADGRPDLAVANNSSNTISILLGTSTGGFVAAFNYAAGTGPQSVAVGDFNADGKPDLAVANISSNNVTILLGAGVGTFGAPTNFPLGTNPISVAVGDFNADGRRDLAVANNSSNTVSILLGNANGTFQAAVNYGAGLQPVSVAVGDFDGDGRRDLAVVNNGTNKVSILIGTGTGSFGAATSYLVGTNPISVAVGDFNGDSRPDLAVANNDSNNVSILLGTGFGRDFRFGAATNFEVVGGPGSVAVGNFNADTKLDLAVANSDSNTVSILLGNANGTFQSPINYAVSSRPRFVAVGDFNADVRTDLAVANGDGDNVSILLAFPLSIPPLVTTQPATQSVLSGASVSFTTAATSPPGGTTPTYRWRRNGVNLVNAGSVSGATTPTLTINPVALSDNGAAFDCVASNACGPTPSNPAGLAVDNICPADFNNDGFVNADDFDAFVNAFVAGC